MKLSNTRITATHTTGMNVWGSHSFQASFPKEIAFEGAIDSKNYVATSVIVSVSFKDSNGHIAGSTVKGMIVGNTIKLGSKGVKGMCVSNYEGQDLDLVVLNRQGKLIHKQPLNKVAKVKDIGHFKG